MERVRVEGEKGDVAQGVYVRLGGPVTVKVDGGNDGLIDGEAQGFRNQIMKARGDICFFGQSSAHNPQIAVAVAEGTPE